MLNWFLGTSSTPESSEDLLNISQIVERFVVNHRVFIQRSAPLEFFQSLTLFTTSCLGVMGTDIDSGDTNAIEAFDLLLASWILLGTTAGKFFIDVVAWSNSWLRLQPLMMTHRTMLRNVALRYLGRTSTPDCRWPDLSWRMKTKMTTRHRHSRIMIILGSSSPTLGNLGDAFPGRLL
jgi:hypothetical protein